MGILKRLPSRAMQLRSLAVGARGPARSRAGLRRLGTDTCVASHGAFKQPRRHVHERPFHELPEDLSQGEAYAMARDALLQLNVMHRRGIEPDALMYTSLIATMGRAGLEWQAYKLFSRMVEQNVQPLPETYVALRDATSKQRVALREQIQAKIDDAVNVFPEELAETERQRQREEDRRCVAKFNEYMRGVLPAPAPTAAPAAASTAAESHREEARQEPAASVSSMHIRNPRNAWETAQMAGEHRSAAQGLAHGTDAADIRRALERLDEEELRIFLAAQRELRHGDKAQLVDRVLAKVSSSAIRAMLERRAHYFRSVEQILAADLRQLNMMEDSSAPPSPPPAQHDGSNGGRADHTTDRTLTAVEKEASGPEVLHAPWGILRKPMRRRREPPAPRNAERLERVRLSAPELLLVRQKAELNDLDELPESLLRRYAYQFQLRWRRKEGASSLLHAVQWHVTTYFSSALQSAAGGDAGEVAGGAAAPTPAIRLRQEAEGMQQTLDNFEAFRVIAQRTNNLQVVDNKEINRHLQHVRKNALRQERKVETALRRERHMTEAAGLAASATSFTPLPRDGSEGDGAPRVLGLAGQGSADAFAAEQPALAGEPATGGRVQDALTTAEDAAGAEQGEDGAAEELPPWAIFEEEDEFNLSSGRFGDPAVGRYQELSDSRVRLLPSRAAQAKWSVDRQLLPTTLRDIVQEAELEQQQRHEAVEREYERRLHYTKYRKWDHLISKAQSKRAEERAREEEEAGGAVRPLPPKRRLSQLLRKGRDHSKVPEEVRAKFRKGL